MQRRPRRSPGPRGTKHRSCRRRFTRRLRLEALEEKRLLTVTAVDDDFTTDEDTVLRVGSAVAADLGDEWLYFDEILRTVRSYPDGNQAGVSWNDPTYDANNPEYASWKTGNALFGYGTINTGPIVTSLNGPASNYTTYLFRRTFTLNASQAQAASGTLDYVFDDGAIVYINGNRVFDVNPPATAGTDEFASGNGSEDYVQVTVDLTGAGLLEGENLLAVELHNTSAGSSDVGMDMALSIDSSAGGILYNDSTTYFDKTLTASVLSQPANGTLDLNDNGTFTYTPNAEFFGIDSFMYWAKDNQNLQDFATVTITVNPIEDPPMAVDDTYTVSEDVALLANAIGDVTPQEFVARGSTWYYIDTMLNSNMPTGPMDYPTDGEGRAWNTADFDRSTSALAWKQGPAQFGFGGIDAGAHATVLAGQRDAPNGQNSVTTYLFRSTFDMADPTSVAELDVGLLSDDGGILYINGQEVYRTPNLVGKDVTADLWSGAPPFGEVFTTGIRIYVGGILNAGSNTIAYELHNNSANSFDVGFDLSLTEVPPANGFLANDFDPEGDDIGNLQIVPGSGPSDGVLELDLAMDGRFVYTPNPDFNGTDSFQYTIDAGGMTSRTATVTIDVLPTPDQPVAHEDRYQMYATTVLNVPAELGLLANDVDPDGTTPTVAAFTDPVDTTSGETVGSLQVTTDGTLSYTPSLGYEGQVAFDYTLSTPDGREGTGSVLITVLESPFPPIILVDPLSTNERSPELTGVVSDKTAAIEVEIAGNTYSAINNGDFTWTLPAGQIVNLAEGWYDVVVRATNQYGTGVDETDYELEIDLTPPTVTIDPLLTADPTPGLTGTISDLNLPVRVTVDGITYDAANHGDGLWSLPNGIIVPALSSGVYDVLAEATDAAGNVGVDVTIDELEVDVTPPIVAVDVQTHDDSTPPITGTVDDPLATVSVTIGTFTDEAVNNGDGTWILPDDTVGLPLANGTYEVMASSTDTLGNTGYDTTTNELTINIQTIVVTVDSLLTNDTTPPLTGTVNDPDAAIAVTVAGNTYAVVNPADGTWTLPDNAITVPLQSGTHSVAVRAENGAVVGTDTSSDALTIDVTPPVVTVDALFTHDEYPALSGTVDDPAAVVKVLVDYRIYPADNQGDGTWTIAAGMVGPLADGVYDVAATATDVAGNTGTDQTVDELTADVWPTPVAVDDAYAVSYFSTTSVSPEEGVLANDFDSEGNPLTATLVTDPTYGQVTLWADGSFEYQAGLYFVGTDSFTYRAANDWYESEAATVWIDVSTVADGTLFVDADAVGAATGNNWTDAYPDLQPALAASRALNDDVDPANDIAEIWIAEGIYKPTEPLEVDDVRTATFALVSGVSLIGGFAGNETTLGERTIVDGSFPNETILSGDIGTVDDTSDNAFTVVYADSASETETTLDGLTITAGNADGNYFSSSARYRSRGGGVYHTGSGTLMVTNSTISGNSGKFGGGIRNDSGTLMVTNSTLSGNAAHNGGGIHNYSGTLTVTNSTLSENSASYQGGGIYNSNRLTVTNSTLSGNSASDQGGGISSYYASRLTVTNSTLSGNSARYNGGGIFNYYAITVTVTNSTLSGNSADYGGGVYNYRSRLIARNSIVALNEAPEGADVYGSYSNSSSLIAEINPGFVRLPSDGGDGWADDPETVGIDESANNDYGNLRLLSSSFAINKGDSGLLPADTLDLDNDGDTTEPVPVDREGNPRVVGGAVDLGAFEFQDTPEPPSAIVVTTQRDEIDWMDGDTSLREAIAIATIDGRAIPITFGASLVDKPILLDGGELRLEADMRIDASTVGGVTIDAQRQSRIFTVTAGVSVELVALNITGGSAYNGGGIYNSGTLTVTNSTLSGNSADDGGGGIYNGSGTLTVTNSTLSGNSARYGGGISNSSGTLTITNSTLSGNSATDNIGGIYTSYGTLTITNSMVAYNTGTNLYRYGGTVALHHSLMAMPDGTDGIYGGWSDDGDNLLGVDPMFARNPSAGADGLWGTEDDDFGDLRLRPDSPAIDVGSDEVAVDADDNALVTDGFGNPRFFDGDRDGTATVDIGAFEYAPWAVGRYVFYNNSAFDGNNPWLGSGDDAAIAVDKVALLPGETATAANVTSFERGINGVMIDVYEFAQPTNMTPGDFAFRVGNVDDPATWDVGPAPGYGTIRPGEGIDGSDRVTLLWADGAIRNTWLEVTVKANAVTGLGKDHVFYFGNAVGETGNSTTDALVNAADVIAIRDNPRGELNPAGVDNPFDVNRDARVDAVDLILARNNATSPLAALRLITPEILGLAPASLPEGEMKGESGERKAESGRGTAIAAAKLRRDGDREDARSRLGTDSRWWERIGG